MAGHETTEAEVPRPLDGIRVIELAQWIAGPSSAGLMADWGADIVKVEPPGGDPQRTIFKSLGIDKEIPNATFAIVSQDQKVIGFAQRSARCSSGCGRYPLSILDSRLL